MASQQQIKRRIGSVRSTKQITRAMQLVAASKLRRAQDAVVGPREYARVAREVLTHLRRVASGEAVAALFAERPVKRRLLIVVASDRTLAGAYNANIVRQLLRELAIDQQAGRGSEILCIGRQVAHAASRVRGLEVVGVYQDMPDTPDTAKLSALLATAMQRFSDGLVDQVDLIFTEFVSAVSQRVRLQGLLPAGFEETGEDTLGDATVEPSAEVVLAQATLRLLQAQLYQAMLEASAAEHSMRMLAMKNATDNASDIIDDLTLAYNNARQAAITQQLAEISGGVEALNT